MFAPLGIPAVLIADDPDLLSTARAAYSDWVTDAPAAEPQIEIRLETASAPSTSVGCGIRVKGSRLELAGRDFAGQADARSKTASSTVPRRLIGDPDRLAAEVTDTLLLFLLSRSGRTPVHAAGVMAGDTLLVLTGPSGSGKSTLALAAAQRGLRVLSDDTLYVQREPALRVWALPRPIHVFPEDAPGQAFAIRDRGGKRKAAIPLPRAESHAPVEAIVPILLEQGERLELTRLTSEAARAATARLEPGFDLLPEESGAAMEALLKSGAWRLTLERDAGAAVDFLLRHFGPLAAPRK